MDTAKISDYIDTGWHDRYWYKHTQEMFEEIFGKDELKLVASLFAATSMNSSLKSNIRLFRRAYDEIKRGVPHVRYMPGIRDQLNKLRDGGELSGNKIRAFAAAMSGDTEAVVVDIWLLRAFGEDRKYKRHTGPHAGKDRSGGATDKQFREIEHWVREEAKLLAIQPRELSAIIWSGARITLSGDRNTRYHEILKHQLYNMFEEVRQQ